MPVGISQKKKPREVILDTMQVLAFLEPEMFLKEVHKCLWIERDLFKY